MAKDIIVASFQPLTKDDAPSAAKFGYYLSAELHKEDRLINFVVSSKGKFHTPFPSTNVSIFSRSYLLILRKLDKLFRFNSYHMRLLQEWIFDFFFSFKLNKDIRVFISTNPFMPRSFRKAKQMGILTILIPANPEELYIHKLVLNEAVLTGIKVKDPYTYERRQHYYQIALKRLDYVIAHSSVILQSYKENFDEKRVISCEGLLHFYRDDLESNIPLQPKSISGKMKFGYLAYTVLLKGLHILLDIWNRLDNEHIELYIGGPFDISIQDMILKKISAMKYPNVKLCGTIKDKDNFFRDLDWFICPSMIDGGPVTVIESLERNVPVVVSNRCGIKDLLKYIDAGYVIKYEDKNQFFEIMQKITTGEYQKKVDKERLKSVLREISLNQLADKLKKEIHSLEDSFFKKLPITIN